MRHEKTDSGEYVITTDGKRHRYQPRAEHTVLKNGSLATDLIQSSVPRWKVWMGHVGDIGKYLVSAWLVITYLIEPRAVKWINGVIDAKMAEVYIQLNRDRADILDNQRQFLVYQRDAAVIHGSMVTREELDRHIAELDRRIQLLQRQTERIR